MGMVKLFETPDFKCDNGSGVFIKCSEEMVCHIRAERGKWDYADEDQSLVK